MYKNFPSRVGRKRLRYGENCGVRRRFAIVGEKKKTKKKGSAFVVCKIDTFEILIVVLEENMQQFERFFLHNIVFALFCVDYTQDISRT